MTTLKNEIIINAPIEKIWKELATVDRLSAYDPGAKESKALSKANIGTGAKRRVNMNDGKNWFEETCTIYEENKDLKYELNACSFPGHNLNHRYSFEKQPNGSYKVTQIQNYTMKYGTIGQLMGLMLKPKWNRGVRGFLKGLKAAAEKI